jgi:hypothetical protein
MTNTLVLCSSHREIQDRLHRIDDGLVRFSEGVVMRDGDRYMYCTPDQLDHIKGLEINCLVMDGDVTLSREQETYLKAHIRPERA